MSFKSYYVVWKQKTNVDEKEIIESLNRTMQYGNRSDNVFSFHNDNV